MVLPRSQRKLTPTEFSQVINRFYAAATKVIIEEDGLVEKLAGDEVAAFWGAGFAGPDYVRRTINVAQSLLRVMESQKIPVGIGVHSGDRLFWRDGNSRGPDRHIGERGGGQYDCSPGVEGRSGRDHC